MPNGATINNTFRELRTSVLIGCLIVFASVTASAQDPDEDLFPVPVGLEPDVNFWLSVFTDYSTREGVLHDNRFLGVVYERVPLPENVNRRERQRIANRRRDYYKGILQALAGGNRDNLNAEQKRVLDLWPADVSDAELGRAAGRIRLQLGLSDRFKEGLQRAGRWRYHVESELTRLGVPIELAALPHVESSYNPEARSHVGASGVWQFTRGTGRRFMQVDHVLDERNDPFLATTAAGKLLAYNYSIAGNWPMAITAYNHGLAGARRAMRQFGDNAYAEILRKYNGRTFGFASRNFYVAFLAAKEVDLNQQKYFPGLVPDDPVDYTTHRLTGYVPADKLLEVLQVRERDIARHNMSIQATVWRGSKHLPRDLEIRMPTSMVDGELSELIAKLSADDVFDEQLPDLSMPSRVAIHCPKSPIPIAHAYLRLWRLTVFRAAIVLESDNKSVYQPLVRHPLNRFRPLSPPRRRHLSLWPTIVGSRPKRRSSRMRRLRCRLWLKHPTMKANGPARSQIS